MKKLFSLVALFLGVSAVYAQDLLPNEVPSVVLNSFNRAFPDATDVEWEREGSLYQVEFERQRRDHDVWLDQKGNIVRQKQDVNPRDLPQEVKNAVKAKYGNGRIDDVDKIQEGSKTRYKIEVDTRNGDHEFYMDPRGQIIHQKEDISPRDLPQEVKDAIRDKYGNARIDDVEKIQEGNKTHYKIEVDTQSGDHKFYMDQKGQIINRRK